MTNVTTPDTGGEMETVTSADGTTIAYERTGSGPPLVLVHGGGDVHEFWDLAGARTAFADHFTVYAMDRRGHGESGDATVYALEREAEDVAAVVDQLEEPVVLLGYSYGALCALEATLRTDKLCKLVLNEPPIQVGDHEPLEVEEAVAEIQRLLDEGENERALVLMLEEVAQFTPDELGAARSSPIWPDMVDAAHALPRELRANAEYEFDAARFADVTTPTLMLTGGESLPFFTDAAEAVTDAFSNSRLVTFDGHAHEPMNTAPDRFTDEVFAFALESN